MVAQRPISGGEDGNRGPHPPQDPYGGFGTTHVGSAARAQPRLGVPAELLRPDAGAMTRGEYEAWDEEHRGNAYRAGKVHIQRGMCSTCVFRPGNLMHLPAGRVEEMVEEACGNDSAIICHQTLDDDNSVCFGFYQEHSDRSASMRATRAMPDVIEWTDPA